jgi:hypothetical protein
VLDPRTRPIFPQKLGENKGKEFAERSHGQSHWPERPIYEEKGRTGENLGRPHQGQNTGLIAQSRNPKGMPRLWCSRPALDQSVSTVALFLPSLSTGKEEITSAHIARSSGSAALDEGTLASASRLISAAPAEMTDRHNS